MRYAILLLFLLGCAPAPSSSPGYPKSETGNEPSSKPLQASKEPAPVQVKNKAREGDANISIDKVDKGLWSNNTEPLFVPVSVMTITVHNTSDTIIVRWEGMYNIITKISDEHKNEFRLLPVWGWDAVYPDMVQRDLDRGERIMPGARITRKVYFESLAPVSKRVTVTAKIGDTVYQFSP